MLIRRVSDCILSLRWLRRIVARSGALGLGKGETEESETFDVEGPPNSRPSPTPRSSSAACCRDTTRGSQRVRSSLKSLKNKNYHFKSLFFKILDIQNERIYIY